MHHFTALCIAALLSTTLTIAQAPKNSSSSDIYNSIKKLNFLGSALYIAAHPDDENTRLISYLSNKVKARTAYLSLTRGDGGQNLIGSELRELLGVLRTQELLAARNIDGGEQFFSRANDFGYSKHPDETLKIWNKEDVLGDVVQIIRNFKPDIIINRFDHRTPGSTHGHHTSSAMLSVEAYDLAGDLKAYTKQLASTEIWQPKRLFFNTSWWFYGSQEKFKQADKTNLMHIDTGVFYPTLGISNNEIASLASSQHLCQGFGRLSTRGSQPEYIELIKGNLPNNDDIFEGINTTWSRIKGGNAIGKILYGIEDNFDFINPSKHLPQLLAAHKLLSTIENKHWKHIKLKELENIILLTTGLYLEASANVPYTNAGGVVKLNVEVLNRSTINMVFRSFNISPINVSEEKNIPLKNNKKHIFEVELKVPKNTAYTNPYWLNKKSLPGMYTVDNSDLIGKAETPRAFLGKFKIDFEGYIISFSKPIVHRYAKPDKGELYQPFEIIPEATARFNDKVLIFADRKSKQIPITVKAHKDNAKGEVQFSYSKGWMVDTNTKSFEIAKKGDEQILVFTLTPPENEDESYISPIVKINGKEITNELVTIAYDHVPTQLVLLPAKIKVVRLDLQKTGKNIGYIEGAGDTVFESLKQIGYSVTLIDPSKIQKGSLKKFDAIVVGIRAYNVIKDLKFKQPFLFDYVKNGGNLIVQYNTIDRRNKQFENIAPYPLKLSRDRVTDENSKISIIAKNHPLMNFPNAITEKDFKGWVQERGLYFPNEWDTAFTPILSMNDTGESAKKGSLLVAPYGKGYYMYTALSFFRELPAGVSGAYKIFANMIALGKAKKQNSKFVKE